MTDEEAYKKLTELFRNKEYRKRKIQSIRDIAGREYLFQIPSESLGMLLIELLCLYDFEMEEKNENENPQKTN